MVLLWQGVRRLRRQRLIDDALRRHARADLDRVGDRGVKGARALVISEGGKEAEASEAKEERVATIVSGLALEEAIVEVQRGFLLLLLEVIEADLSLD